MVKTIKELRLEKGLRLKDVAARLGVSSSTLCNWERGIRECPIKKLVWLSYIYAVPISYIVHSYMKTLDQMIGG